MAQSDAYVDAALQLGGYALDPAAAARVQTEFSRIATIAAVLSEQALGQHDEPLPVYRP